MTGHRILIHTIFVLLLPLIVAWFGMSFAGALGLLIVALAWRWAISLSGIVAPAKTPDLELETIGASHFVEKVRWCLDRLGVEYTERQMVGVLGVFFTGRSVPQLKIRSGLVRSSIGNSPEILRYLWGAYAATLGDSAKFLEPTRERLELEKRLDRYGVDLQVWVYYHILDDRELTLYGWGCSNPVVPAWQRYTVMAIFPVLRVLMRKAFRISETGYARAVENIECILAEFNGRLANGRRSIVGTGEIDFVDITFASISALWMQPPEFGGETSAAIRIDRERAPPAMRTDIERWITTYPDACGFISRLYQRERQVRM